jgi:pimeloyl-ACP methyl ester carboxylesterase
MVEAWADVDGRPVRSLSLGRPGELPEVVLLPGLGAPSYLYPWLEQTATWTRGTVLDLPGWRGGRGRSSPSTVEGVGVAAAGWLETRARRDIVLVGHSSGAQSAIHTARLVPGRLAGLVLVGPTLDPRARHLPNLLVRLLLTVIHERLSELPAVLPWYVRSGGLSWLRLVGSVITDRPENGVRTLDLPVQVLSGELDRFAPPGWSSHLAGLASGRYTMLPGAHNACYTAPRATDAALRAAVVGWSGARH